MDWPLPAFCFFLLFSPWVARGVGWVFGPSRFVFSVARRAKKFFAGGQAGPLQHFGSLALSLLSSTSTRVSQGWFSRDSS